MCHAGCMLSASCCSHTYISAPRHVEAIVRYCCGVYRPQSCLRTASAADRLISRRRAARSAAFSVQRQSAVRCAAAADVGQDVDALNSKFGIPEHVMVKPGRGGLPMVQLQHTCGASAEVHLQLASDDPAANCSACCTTLQQLWDDPIDPAYLTHRDNHCRCTCWVEW